MHSRVAQVLVRLYPRQWRERYGDEFVSLVEESNLGSRQFVNVASAAAEERAILMVRWVLGNGREDAVIRDIARFVVRLALAWFAAGAVHAVFPVVATVVGVAMGLCGWGVVRERAQEIWYSYGSFLGAIWAPVVLTMMSVLVAPIVIALKMTSVGRFMPVAARVVTIAAIACVGVALRMWLDIGFRWLPMLDTGLSLASGGTVIAFALFPRPHRNPAIKPSQVVPA